MTEQDENQNYAAKFREAQKEIDRLARERDEARAACAAMRGCLSKLLFHMKYWGSQEDGVPEDMYNDWKAALELVNSPNPGQSLLNEIDRLRRLEAAVVNREFVWQCPCTDCEDTTDCQDAICAALLAAMKGE